MARCIANPSLGSGRIVSKERQTTAGGSSKKEGRKVRRKGEVKVGQMKDVKQKERSDRQTDGTRLF